METAESATLQRIGQLWNALKSQVRKLPNSDEWRHTIDEVEQRIKHSGSQILRGSERRASPEDAIELRDADRTGSQAGVTSALCQDTTSPDIERRKTSQRSSAKSVVAEEKKASPKRRLQVSSFPDAAMPLPTQQQGIVPEAPPRDVSKKASNTRPASLAPKRATKEIRTLATKRTEPPPPSQASTAVVPAQVDVISIGASSSLSKSSMLREGELERLTSKRSVKPPVQKTVAALPPPTSASPPKDDWEAMMQEQRINASLALISRAVQFDSQSSDDDDLISLQRSKRRGRVFHKEDGTSVLVEPSVGKSPRHDNARRIVEHTHETPVILSSKFFPMPEGMQEYLRCSLRDARSVRRHMPPHPCEYVVNDSDQLFAVLDLMSEEFPPTTPVKIVSKVTTPKSSGPSSPPSKRELSSQPVSGQSTPKRHLVPMAKSQPVGRDDEDDDESLLLSSQRKLFPSNLSLPVEKSSGRKRKKGNKSKESRKAKVRRKKLLSFASDRLAVYAGEKRGITSDDELLDEDMYQVDRILDVMLDSRDRKFYFYVKWKDYGDEDNTWEPEENLEFGDHSARITYLKALHEKRMEVSQKILLDDGFEWKEVAHPGRYNKEFNDYMKSFVVLEKHKRDTGMLEPFCVQARQWIHPRPPAKM